MSPLLIGCWLFTPWSLAGTIDYEKAAQAAKWQWQGENANLLQGVYTYLDRYRVEISAPQRGEGNPGRRELTVRVLQNETLLHTFSAYPEVVFILYDYVLYIAYPRQGSTGCSVVAYDLRAKKQLWETRLQSVSRRPHSFYRNRVTMTRYGNALVITGNETLLRYIEFVDMKTGKTLAQREFPLD